jgi:glutathione S-transferase
MSAFSSKQYLIPGLVLVLSIIFSLQNHIFDSISDFFFPDSLDLTFFHPSDQATTLTMAEHLYIAETPDEVKNAKGLHLITQSTPNGQKVQILLEELADTYHTQWTTTIINISTNEQKKEWFLRLNPNGRIPVLIDNSESPPFTVMETSAELLYLLKFADKDDKFGFKDELERNECLQWLFFCKSFRFSQPRAAVVRRWWFHLNYDRVSGPLQGRKPANGTETQAFTISNPLPATVINSHLRANLDHVLIRAQQGTAAELPIRDK